MNPKIILISSVLPSPTSAGEVVLYRHLSQLDNYEVCIPESNSSNSRKGVVSSFYKRLQKTRLHPFLKDLELFLNGYRWEVLLAGDEVPKKDAIVLTVAHGDGCWAALRFAQKYTLPLVTIFHDWWPDCPTVHRPFRQILEDRFQRLYRESTVALCVSQSMKDHLGKHPNSVVLYPIPASVQKDKLGSTPGSQQPTGVMRVAYCGGLYDYGPMLADLLNATKDHPHIELQVRGKRPNWPAEFKSEMRDRGLWLDFAPREELEGWLHSMDVLLVAMSFSPLMKRRMKTSFSSKLLDYVQFGKPILVWGPDYCSAVAWAKENDKALYVTDENPKAVLESLHSLRQSYERINHYANQAQYAALGEFNSAVIQQNFLKAIKV